MGDQSRDETSTSVAIVGVRIVKAQASDLSTELFPEMIVRGNFEDTLILNHAEPQLCV